jgi:hypothetical protein
MRSGVVLHHVTIKLPSPSPHISQLLQICCTSQQKKEQLSFRKFHIKEFTTKSDIVCESRIRNFTEIFKLRIRFKFLKN